MPRRGLVLRREYARGLAAALACVNSGVMLVAFFSIVRKFVRVGYMSFTLVWFYDLHCFSSKIEEVVGRCYFVLHNLTLALNSTALVVEFTPLLVSVVIVICYV
jgi:hypothetical protein